MSAPARFRPPLLWLLAVVLTLALVVYQRRTGPTYPIRGSVEVAGATVPFRLLRTHETTADAPVRLAVPDAAVSGELVWRRYRSHDEWSTFPMRREGDELVGAIPRQPPAGKVMYRVRLLPAAGGAVELTAEPVIIRFKGAVPTAVLAPHILLMFSSMLLAVRTGFEALTAGARLRAYALATALSLLGGGLVLGPIVQKYAFGALWTGWPLGHDLTDNKTAVAMLAWMLALWRSRAPGKGRGWVLAAVCVQLLVYSIPHSLLGSELDYTKTE
jgi:hypothetical protein